MLGAIEQRNIDMFEVFDRRVVYDRRRIGEARASEASKRQAAPRPA
jgi:hypothetical protein